MTSFIKSKKKMFRIFLKTMKMEIEQGCGSVKNLVFFVPEFQYQNCTLKKNHYSFIYINVPSYDNLKMNDSCLIIL